MNALAILIVLALASGTAYANRTRESAIFPPGLPGGAPLITATAPRAASRAPTLSRRAIAAQCAVTSYAYGIPRDLLLAIAITESGRHGAPWPWTLDVDGQPEYLRNRQATIRAAESAVRAGHERIDIGPMQIDWLYHGTMFPSLASLTHPFMNIAAAGRILSRLHARTRNWWTAVADYHSAKPSLGRPYMWRVYHVYETLQHASEGSL